MNQIDLHNEIDMTIKRGQTGTEKVSRIIQFNSDARNYFFVQANEHWLEWLWENSFFDGLGEKSEELAQSGYRTPELNYLVSVAPKNPSVVVDIMLATADASAELAPGVVSRFLDICSELPANQLKRMIEVIRDKRWVILMGDFNQWGFEYEKMFKTLAEAGDYKSMLVLAQAVLTVRPKDEEKKSRHRYSDDDPFYFSHLSDTKLFDYLVTIGEEYKEDALKLAVQTLREIVLTGEEDDSVFGVDETYHLYDVDFFKLRVGGKKRLSYREDIKNLAAVVKTLAVDLIGILCNDQEKVRGLYNQYFAVQPESQSLWRLRLFVMSLCPDAFSEELRKAFFRIFETERYHDLIVGAEYYKSLRATFPSLPENDQRDYVQRVVEYFSEKSSDEADDMRWKKVYAWRILSSISPHLTEEEKRQCKVLTGKDCDENFEPGSAIGEMKSGMVRPKGPMTQEEFRELPIADISQRLRGEWQPEKLREQNTDADFLTPLNAEGVGELLRADVALRLQDYVSNALSFFDRDKLDQHYTYSFLRGVQEAIRENKEKASAINWSGIIDLFVAINASGEAQPFQEEVRKREQYEAWLARWGSVHTYMADVIQELTRDYNERAIIANFLEYRDKLLATFKYLFSHEDPTVEGEREDRDEYDPHGKAINSVRGRTFEAFIWFVYQDGKQLDKNVSSKIRDDVKELYQQVLEQEKTQAIMFMFGHYLPSFYFRDRKWVRELLPLVFSESPDKHHLYVAAWEGFLTNNLYGELFADPAIRHLYERGLTLEVEKSERRRTKDPEEGLAVHLALAFMFYKSFDFDDSLFKAFWDKDDPEQHAEFVSHIGRLFVSGDNAQANAHLEKEAWAKERMQVFWDWMLERNEKAKVYEDFGTWIGLGKDLFEGAWLAERVRKTLEKTNGALDWDYGLVKSIDGLAKAASEDALAITRLFLFDGGVHGESDRFPMFVDSEWFEAFKIMYSNQVLQPEVRRLISDLIRDGGSTFWKLKEVIKE